MRSELRDSSPSLPADLCHVRSVHGSRSRRGSGALGRASRFCVTLLAAGLVGCGTFSKSSAALDPSSSARDQSEDETHADSGEQETLATEQRKGLVSTSGSKDADGTSAAPPASGSTEQQGAAAEVPGSDEINQNAVQIAQGNADSGKSAGVESDPKGPQVGLGAGQGATEAITEGGATNANATAPGAAPSPAPQTETVAAFLLQGHMGRTALSCDGGKSWVADQSLDDGARCFTGGLDCDHTSWPGRGIASDGVYTYVSFGWGQPGPVRRTRDGITFENVLVDNVFAGLAYGQGVLMGGDRTPDQSTNSGQTWVNHGYSGLVPWNAREIHWVPFKGGRFILMGQSGAVTDLRLSDDAGLTWKAASGFCAPGNLASNGDGTLMVHASGSELCVSGDGGATWKRSLYPEGEKAGPVWNGSAFLIWADGQMHASTDGVNWSSQNLNPPQVSIDHVSFHPDLGAYVAISDGWMSWYEKQRAYRSVDGVNWDVLSEQSFRGGHPVRYLKPTHVMKSPLCPSEETTSRARQVLFDPE